uniref:Carboxylic ester hydrolase n=1 Tax=Anopheles melas TaxID=34690 RepID=A0A182TFS5_9DIPT
MDALLGTGGNRFRPHYLTEALNAHRDRTGSCGKAQQHDEQARTANRHEQHLANDWRRRRRRWRPSQKTVLSSLLLLTVMTDQGVEASSPIVNLAELGALRGSTGTSAWTGRKFYLFLGVHYAQTTSGKNRFRLAAKRPVMVFIHGGGFYEGCAKNQTGEYLMERDVVLVTIQYRLGPLGFLQTDTGSIPGNMGLMDMKLALEWVQEHIGRFGGDPANVTLFGQSAGAAAISALLYSPQVPDGLFHKVILQSAGSSAPWVWDREPLQSVRDLAFEAGEEFVAPEEEIDTFYQNVDVWKLLQVFNEYKVKTTLESGLDRVGGNRLVTGDWERYLPQTPLECMKQGKVRPNIPMMAGVTKHEGTFLLTTVYDHFKRTGKLDDPAFVKYGLMDAVSKFLGAGDDPTGAFVGYQMRSLFTSKELESGSFGEMADGLIDLAGTILIKAPLLREAQANARVNPNATYLYTFDYVGEHSRFGYGNDTSHYPFGGGVHHSDDKLYLFPYPPGKPDALNERDTAMAKLMVDLWTSFAAEGVPKSDRLTVPWTPMTAYAGPYLHINDPPSVGDNFYREFTAASDEKRSRNKERT